MANSQDLESMKLPELKELAKQMGLRGTSTMRKPELLATLQAARSGGEAPAGVTVKAPKASAPKASASKTAEPAEDKGEKAEAQAKVQAEAAPGKADAASKTAKRGHASNASKNDQATGVADLLATLDIDAAKEDDHKERKPRRRVLDELDGEELIAGNVRRRRHRKDQDAPSEEAARDLDDILASLPSNKQESRNDGDSYRGREERGDRENREGHDTRERRGRRLRGRNRDFEDRDEHRNRGDRNDRGARNADNAENGNRDAVRNERNDRNDRNDRTEQQADLVPVAGIVDVLESYAFIRTSGYLPGPNDVYVSMGQVKKYGLRKGDAVHGAIRAPREGERRNQRQKFVPLQSIDSINGMSVEESMGRPQFNKLTPLYPQERLKQETTPNKLTGRIMDIISPIGKGQRGLIVSPPKAGKTITLQNIANAITTNNPEVHLMVVLVDERPEEVTDMERTVQGEVISSTFDRPASDHTIVAELAIERAKRLVELGQDVVVLLDSMTRLARAYNIAAPASGRILSGGVDAQALYPPKKFFGAARNIENGGSLTIISSALVETGSKMDEVIFEEFKGTGNMELRLSRELAEKRMFPAIDVNASGTRREELITDPKELPVIYRLRRLFGGMEAEQAYQTLVPRLKKTASNRDFLSAIVQQANASNATNGN